MFIFWACQNHLRISFVSLFYSFVGALAGRSVSWGCVIRRHGSRGRVSRGRVSRGRVSRGFVRGHPLRGAVCQHPVLGQILSWEPWQVGWRNRQKRRRRSSPLFGACGIHSIPCRTTDLAPGWFEEIEGQTFGILDDSEKWMIIWFTPNQSNNLTKWMFFQKLFFKSGFLAAT